MQIIFALTIGLSLICIKPANFRLTAEKTNWYGLQLCRTKETEPNLDCLVIRFIDCSNFGLVLNRIIRQTIIFHPEQRKPNLVSTEPNLDCLVKYSVYWLLKFRFGFKPNLVLTKPNLDCLVVRFIGHCSNFGLVSNRIWF